MLIYAVAQAALRHDKAIQVLYSFCAEHFVFAAVRVLFDGNSSKARLLSEIGYVPRYQEKENLGL